MELKYKKSNICSDYYIIMYIEKIKCGNEPVQQYKNTLDFTRVLWNLSIGKDDFIHRMRQFNGIRKPIIGNYHFDYIFFPSELDVQNAIEYITSLELMDKLADDGVKHERWY